MMTQLLCNIIPWMTHLSEWIKLKSGISCKKNAPSLKPVHRMCNPLWKAMLLTLDGGAPSPRDSLKLCLGRMTIHEGNPVQCCCREKMKHTSVVITVQTAHSLSMPLIQYLPIFLLTFFSSRLFTWYRKTIKSPFTGQTTQQPQSTEHLAYQQHPFKTQLLLLTTNNNNDKLWLSHSRCCVHSVVSSSYLQALVHLSVLCLALFPLHLRPQSQQAHLPWVWAPPSPCHSPRYRADHSHLQYTAGYVKKHFWQCSQMYSWHVSATNIIRFMFA